MSVHDPIAIILEGGPGNRSSKGVGAMGYELPRFQNDVTHLARLFESVAEQSADSPAVTAKSCCMLGYWRDAIATANRIRSRWLHTGDLASRDSARWIALHGRSSAFVKIAGFRVQPADLVDFAVERLAATQAVAVPCDLPDLGSRLVLYVRPDVSCHELALSEMVARCRAELSRQLVPESFQLVDEFPLNSAYRIDRPRLQRWAEKAKPSYTCLNRHDHLTRNLIHEK